MPEGAEVKIIGEGLAKLAGNRRLVSIEPISGRYSKKPIPGMDLFQPSKVLGVGVKGKLIFLILDCDAFLLNTLGMTASWQSNPGKHSRVKFTFDSGDPIYFDDTRNFGTLKFVGGRKSLIRKLESLGPDLLSEVVSDEKFAEALSAKPHVPICQVLLDQEIVCGIGNYVRAEALYRARVSPHRLVGSLSTQELARIGRSAADVLRTAYTSQGASIKDYRAPSGTKGKATDFFEVYGRKKDPEGRDVLREEDGAGRTIHWVPSVQH